MRPINIAHTKYHQVNPDDIKGSVAEVLLDTDMLQTALDLSGHSEMKIVVFKYSRQQGVFECWCVPKASFTSEELV